MRKKLFYFAILMALTLSMLQDSGNGQIPELDFVYAMPYTFSNFTVFRYTGRGEQQVASMSISSYHNRDGQR